MNLDTGMARTLVAGCVGIIAAFSAASVSATPILGPITATLTGDIRPDNPGGLLINVTITPTTATTVSWVVDLDMAMTHPNARLDEFYFNLGGSAADYSFSGFNPNNWSIFSPASPVGAGGVSFTFEADGPNPTNVTNAQSLSFDMTKTSGVDLMLEDFLLAPIGVSNDAGQGQLGAHVKSLSLVACSGCSDSGFAFGSYNSGDGSSGGGNPPQIPEPATLSLLGFGLAGVGGVLFRTRRRRTA